MYLLGIERAAMIRHDHCIPQQRYDHRLRELVRRTGEVRLATGVGVPRSTARGWLGASYSAVVSLNGADRTEAKLRQEIVTLQRRLTKLAALLRLALVSRPRGGCTLTGERLLDGPDKARLLRAVEGARMSIPLRGILRCCAPVHSARRGASCRQGCRGPRLPLALSG